MVWKAPFILTSFVALCTASQEKCDSMEDESDDVALLQGTMRMSQLKKPAVLEQALNFNQIANAAQVASPVSYARSNSSGLSNGSTVTSHKLYCPRESDMNHESGHVKFHNGGWTLLGISRVSSKTAWNLLGGYIEFDMDTSETAAGVNTNLYTSSMQGPNCGIECYCDIQKGDNPSCMELDIVEVNGQCAAQSTIHTFATDGTPNIADCDRWGCHSQALLPGVKFHIKAEFTLDGHLSVHLSRNNLSVHFLDNFVPKPSEQSNTIVVDTMGSIGAVIESSQWTGWVPAAGECPSGTEFGVDNSRITISNVRVYGTTKQGPDATECGAPTTTPAPLPHCCAWSSKRCGSSNYCNENQKHCETDCHGKWTDPATFPPPPDGCCSWYRNECGDTSDYCKASKDNCENTCKGRWVQV